MTLSKIPDHLMDFLSPPDLMSMRNVTLPDQRERLEAELARRTMRELNPAEIDQLRTQGNSAEDWARVRVSENFETHGLYHSRFEGEVELGRFGRESEKCPSGITYSTLRDCVIGDGVRIARCGLIARQVIGPEACLEDVGRIDLDGTDCAFGNDLVLFHEELFSRSVRAVAELPFEWAAWLSGPGASGRDPEERTSYERVSLEYANRIRSSRGYVGRGVRIRASAVIENCWIGEGVAIDAAGSLRNCTFWTAPGAETVIRDGAQIRNCLIGPGCTVERGATIEDSIFFEEVFAGQQAIVKGCAVGPNSRLAGSEANDSLLGPFTMAIHHGLILAAWWPEGKGNIAYGSNVGSNHTGRAPDQEIFPGEGLFFGLGCSVKFPCNFAKAPHTIVASGVNVLPQKMDFPFSLITAPTRAVAGLSPGLNEIQPGWGLLQNAYGLERHERNMAARVRARRQVVETRILRPAMIRAFQSAVLALEIGRERSKEIYTEDDIPALGKNFMTEESRRQAIEAYRFGIEIVAARGLWNAVADGQAQPEDIKDLIDILGCSHDPAKMAEAIHEAERRWLELALNSRARDVNRGKKIIVDYELRHLGLGQDPTLKAMKSKLNGMEQSASELFAAFFSKSKK